MDIVSQIKAKVDIKEYAEKHTKFKGKQALCFLPGHNEKTPSFSVNTREQYFYCFGCNRGGDVIRLRALVEGITDEEAINRFAEELGLKKGGRRNGRNISLY